MKTLRALFWGAVAGALLGYLFAPRRNEVLRAETGATMTNTAMSRGREASVGMAATRAYVGNTHTRVYHEPGDMNLPTEENRTYFESAAAAEAAGYRPAGHLSTAV